MKGVKRPEESRGHFTLFTFKKMYLFSIFVVVLNENGILLKIFQRYNMRPDQTAAK